MRNKLHSSVDPRRVLAVIMGGGGGHGLYPLTRERATPAIPLAGNYRLVDVPLSNCINSGVRQIYILTQFNSASLHRHVSQSYKFDHFSDGFVEILAAEQTPTDTSWHRGSADAVGRNLVRFLSREFDYLLVLSADQLYRMDFGLLLDQHAQSKADMTIATILVERAKAHRLGILRTGPDYRIESFVEKPADEAVLDSLRVSPEKQAQLGIECGPDHFMASMGIYVFSRNALRPLMEDNPHDFGRDVIPRAIQTHQLCSYLFQGYWEDLGRIRTFFEANLDLVAELPSFNLFEMAAPIFSRPRYLPGARIYDTNFEHALVADGCTITGATVTQSIVGLRSIVGSGSKLNRVVGMGCDFFETEDSIATHESAGLPRIGIGRNTHIENAIIDKNARVGRGVKIVNAKHIEEADGDGYFIREGIVCVPKSGVIPDGTVI